MRQELDELLCAKYPKIFVNRHGDMKETAMCWGFECGDGWFNIIDQLCANIQHHVDWSERQRNIEVKKGIEGESGMPRTPHVNQVIAVQVKEKFGTLRFYTNAVDDQIYGMIRMAESMSAVTCEDCGAPGKLRGRGWLYTACDVHTKTSDLIETKEEE